MGANIYFDLTREFNERGPNVALASGQAVVHYRVALMSKDGDWVIREDAPACAQVLDVLARHGAIYRPGAPLDPRWLAGGWSSHFEFHDDKQRRVRCDYFSRPPRVAPSAIERLFAVGDESFRVIDLESLIRMKQTLRAKDYAVIGALATKLPPEREILFSTDPDRLLQLAVRHGDDVRRPAVQAACAGNRDAVVVALAREQDEHQQRDRARMDAYAGAAQAFITAFGQLTPEERRLPAGHHRALALAEALLPQKVALPESRD